VETPTAGWREATTQGTEKLAVRPNYRAKRLLDLTMLALAALPAMILGILSSLAIWLDDGPPVLFRQVRVGRNGQPFVLLKLRTMLWDEPSATTFPPHDRYTRVGRLLRRMSLDELPQLINVARGEMSVVGPRPTLPYQVRRYNARQLGRLSVLPGLTGLAQVHGRNRMSWSDRIEWDLKYVQNQSLQLDLAILVSTIRTVVSGDGVAAHPRHDPIAQTEERRYPVPGVTPSIRLAKPDIGEEEFEAIREVLTSGILTGGEQNVAFEREFAIRHGAEHGITFSSGTSALAAMLLAEGIGPGDEVIVPSMTFISTATSVRHVGATPVFADIDFRSFNIDPESLPALITRRTRAVMTVHYAGQPADLDRLLKVCADNGLLLLEDAAEAAGAEYRGLPVGTFGKSAMFSFTPTKNITTGEGGIVLTSDAETAERLRLLRNHGQRRLYEHVLTGYNWRLTEMQAAMGRVQLRKLDTILARKRANAAWMNSRLETVPNVTPPYRVPNTRPTHMLYTCLLEVGRDSVLEFLLSSGIEARVYFPPAHLQAIFERQAGSLPVTETVAQRMLSIPMHSLLTREELALVADFLETGARQVRACR
jgi:perosamine synthetase